MEKMHEMATSKYTTIRRSQSVVEYFLKLIEVVYHVD